MDIRGIHHISLKTSSEERFKEAVRFYTEVLGLKIVRTWDEGIMIDSGDGIIEIFNNGKEELPQGVITHIAFAVNDTDACAAKVAAAGYSVFDGPRDVVIHSDPPYPARIAFCNGALGEEIEFFMEKEEDSAGPSGSVGDMLSESKEYDEAQDILVIKDLCKSYPSFRLDKVSFNVKAGRIMGFIGRNGAGKTTTLKCVMGLVKPESGSISYFGRSFSDNEREIKQSIGYASGGVDYFTKKKIKDIISVTKSFYHDWDEEAYKDYMERFGLNENKAPGELSAGMKVKLNLVLALSHHAKLLILDEPTSGLDPVSRDEIMMIFKFLRSCGCAILFSTHVTSDLDKCADDITYIHDGKLVASTTKERFISGNRQHGSNVEEIMIWYEHEKGEKLWGEC